MDKDLQRFQERLDECHEWPCSYCFKFIVPHEQADVAENLFPDDTVRRRPSSKGKYVSITAEVRMETSDEVIEVYSRACKIPGVIML
jgi:hypothetical protein